VVTGERAAPAPGADEVQPVANETRDRIITGTVTMLPFLALGVVCWQLWERALHWHDLVVFAIVYAATGLGITVGFHRLLTHRAFKTKRWLRATFAALGSAAVEGPVISWVADHRKHHVYADQEGDPHSPHVDHGVGWKGALRGLFHAHLGWLFVHDQRAAKHRFARDLIEDPVIRFVDRTFVLWVALGLLVPFGLGYALAGRWRRRSPVCCGAAWCACSCSTTSPTASTRCATSSGAGASTPTTSRATCCGSRRCPSASRGTTTTTPSPPPRATGCGRGRSTSRRW